MKFRFIATMILGFWYGLAYGEGMPAGGFFQGGTYYRSYTQKYQNVSSQTETRETQTNLNLTLGYSTGSTLVLGLKYISLTHQITISTTQTEKVEALGLGGGFYNSGIYVFLSSMLLQTPKYTISNASGWEKYTDGSGVILDFGYLVQLGQWYFGPQITWQNLSYKKRATNTGSDTNFRLLATTGLEPYLGFGFSF